MFMNEWLKKTQDKYSTCDDIHIENYMRLLDYLRATDKDTPDHMTARLLKRLLTGTSVDDVSRILGMAARYNELLNLFNYYENEASQLKEKASNPAATDEEKEELHAKWIVAWEKREAYWTSMGIVSVPLYRVCFDIEGSKYIWCVDVDSMF